MSIRPVPIAFGTTFALTCAVYTIQSGLRDRVFLRTIHRMVTREQPGRKRGAKKEIEEADITGLKYFDQLAPLLERLHDDGCERDQAGNRSLHYDKYCMLILLYLFNPIVTSLRGIQQASELKKVQRKLGCARASLGSLSEATSVFEADRLKEIIGELGDQLEPLGQDKRFDDIKQTITLVDGSLIAACRRSWKHRGARPTTAMAW